MPTSRRDFCSGALSLALAAAHAQAVDAAVTYAQTVDPAKDSRLACLVRVECEGMPVSRVLRALSEATGVKLSAAGRAGDQRLVAFVPDATLADVMTCLAELFRLEWAPDGPRRNAYTLFKSLGAAKEEAGLRERAVRRALADLSARVRAGRITEKDLVEATHPELAQAAPLLIPLVSGNLELLLREGFVYLPLSRLAAPVLQRLTTLLQPAFDRHHALVVHLQDLLNGENEASGKPGLSIGGADAPASVARDCTLLAEFRFKGQPTIWIGLRDPNSTQYPVLKSPGDDLELAGADLFHGRTLRPVAEKPPARSVSPGEGFDRKIEILPGAKPAESDWIAQLRRLVDASQVPIYTDCYPNFEEGMDGHPRGRFQLSGVTSTTAALDRFCAIPARGARAATSHSYWWAFHGAALVRSRRWLWDEETNLPADLIERLADSIRLTGRPAPRELPGLARLTGAQIQGNGYAEGHLDAWAFGVRAPARLSPASQARLFKDGLDWKQLTPAEQDVLLRLLPRHGGTGEPQYSARFTSRPEAAPSQGGTLLQTEVRTQWGELKSEAGLQLPAPGLTPAGLPRPEALVVRKLE